MGEKIVDALNVNRDKLTYGFSRIFRRIGYILLGIPFGWSLCHHYVNRYGGDYPNVSTVRYIAELIGEFQIIESINSLGGITVISGVAISVVTAYIKIKKG